MREGRHHRRCRLSHRLCRRGSLGCTPESTPVPPPRSRCRLSHRLCRRGSLANTRQSAAAGLSAYRLPLSFDHPGPGSAARRHTPGCTPVSPPPPLAPSPPAAAPSMALAAKAANAATVAARRASAGAEAAHTHRNDRPRARIRRLCHRRIHRRRRCLRPG